MPFCPECKYEYTAAVNKCPDCDQWLVGSLSDISRRSTKSSASSAPRPSSPAEYSEAIRKIMKSLPATPNIPSGPISPSSPMTTEPIEPDPDSVVARKLEEHDSWIAIARFPSRQLSTMVSDALQSVGIPALVMPGYISNTSGGVMRALGTDTRQTFQSMEDDTLIVPEQFVERADAEVAEIMGEEYENYKTPNG